MNKLIILLLTALFAASSYAQQVTVSFKAEVYSTDSVEFAQGDVIEGTLVYDSSPSNPSGMVQDLSPGSQISVTLPNGDTVKTSVLANPFLEIFTHINPHNSGIYSRHTSFSSRQNDNSSGSNVYNMGLNIDEMFFSLPPEFKSMWSPDMSRYESIEFFIFMNNANLLANVTELTSNAPLPPPLEEAFFTVTYTASVTASESQLINVGEQVTGTISYDVTPDVVIPVEPGPYSHTYISLQDREPTSKMTVSFSGGVSAQTSIMADPKININSNLHNLGNGIFQRSTGFRSWHYAQTGISSMGVYLDETLYFAPELFKTEWSAPIESYALAELVVEIDGVMVFAKIDSFNTNRVVTPPPQAPDLFTVSYKAKVKESQVPGIQVDSIIKGELIYDKTNRGEQPYYDETTPGSMMTANFDNGTQFKTDFMISPFMRINSHVTDFNNGYFQREQRYSSQVRSEGGYYGNGDINLIFSELLVGSPSYTKNNWSRPLSDYELAEFYGYINGQLVLADIIEITSSDSAPVPVVNPALSLSSTLLNNVLPNTGDTLQVTHTVQNLVNMEFSVEYWEYITMPNGMIYNVSMATELTLLELEQRQLNTAFSVPSFWPAGQYKYHIATIIPEKGVTNFTTVLFVKH